LAAASNPTDAGTGVSSEEKTIPPPLARRPDVARLDALMGHPGEEPTSR
jgi:hypothetical protein